MKESSLTIKVAIADDHEIFRDGLKLMIGSVSNIQLVGEAANGVELLKLVATTAPDIVVTDIKMPQMDGVEATKQIREQYPHIEVIALSMFDDEQLILEILDAGAIGYLLKNSDKSEMIEAINTAYRHQSYYCKHTSAKLAKLIAYSKHANQKKQKEAEFTDREKEIIKLICAECTNKEIGEKLFISTRTVEGYRMKILEKMDAKNIVGIVIEAIRLGIYSPQV
ncbi:MAG: response regulator transcription factor [Sphingobacteriales bacterium]|nr:MAG: response regulator transcription factor [Sphingobacteriales bacterium]